MNNLTYEIRQIDGEDFLCIRVKDIKRTRSVFTPPGIEEVTQYCKSRGSKVNARQWFDFYTAKGWMIGKNKMKDWQAACRTWEKDAMQGTLPESKGSNLGGSKLPDNYGVPSKTATPMPESFKKIIANIGNE